MVSSALAAALERRNIHYGWVIVAVTFLTTIVTAAAMSTPGVLIVPLQQEFGWDTEQISSALALRLMLFGLFGPFAAAFMNRFGVRAVMVCRRDPDFGRHAGVAGDDAGVAAHSAVGHRRRHRHRAHRHGARGDGGDALVQSPPRPGHGPVRGQQRHRATGVPAADRANHDGLRLADRAGLRLLHVGVRRCRRLHPDARPAERSWPAALRRERRVAAAGHGRRSRLAAAVAARSC